MQPSDPFNSPPQTPPSPAQPPTTYPQPLQGQQQAPSQFTQTAAPQPAKKKHKKLALWLLIGPSVLFVVAMAIAFTAPALFPYQPPAPGEMFGEPNRALTIVNILLYLSSAIVILTWLPGIIIGSILLAKK